MHGDGLMDGGTFCSAEDLAAVSQASVLCWRAVERVLQSLPEHIQPVGVASGQVETFPYTFAEESRPCRRPMEGPQQPRTPSSGR